MPVMTSNEAGTCHMPQCVYSGCHSSPSQEQRLYPETYELMCSFNSHLSAHPEPKFSALCYTQEI